jgi:dCTP deaminase
MSAQSLDLKSQDARYGVLSDKQILAEIKRPRGDVYINPFNMSQLSNTSYDVTLGEYYYIETKEPAISTDGAPRYFNPFHPPHVKRHWGELKQAMVIKDKQEAEDKGCDVGDRVIVIPPNTTILVHTQEYIGGRGNVTTQMKARSGIGRSCLAVCKCAGWGDVGYVSRWTMEMQNTSEHCFSVIPIGERVAQIVFLTSGEPLRSYEKGGSYQTADPYDEKAIQASWKPESMLPKSKRINRPVVESPAIACEARQVSIDVLDKYLKVAPVEQHPATQLLHKARARLVDEKDTLKGVIPLVDELLQYALANSITSMVARVETGDEMLAFWKKNTDSAITDTVRIDYMIAALLAGHRLYQVRQSLDGIIHLNCAYAGTGKDSLCCLIQGGVRIEAVDFAKRAWLIYADEKAKTPSYGKITRSAFADPLKDEVFSAINTRLPPGVQLGPTWQDCEPFKNTLLLPNSDSKLVVLRQQYIDHGKAKREQDIDYWCKAAFGPHKGKAVELFNTDTRFPNEIQYARNNFKTVTTTRLFRSSVKIADKSVESEHALDSELTDYLMVTSDAEFQKAIHIFPQYAGYKLRWYIGSK